MRLLTLLLILCLWATGPAAAGPLEDGVAAARKGDYATALHLLRPLADEGNAVAQSTLGIMYLLGNGVPQDHAAAAFSLASQRYDASDKESRDDAAKNRDRVATKMTPTQIAEAQKLAREWKPGPDGGRQ